MCVLSNDGLSVLLACCFPDLSDVALLGWSRVRTDYRASRAICVEWYVGSCGFSPCWRWALASGVVRPQLSGAALSLASRVCVRALRCVGCDSDCATP